MADAPGSLRAVNVTRDRVLAERVEWAGTSSSRRAGLLGRLALPRGHALYLVPCQWVHMFGMRFPLDVLFLDEAGRVLALHHSLRPNRLSRLVPAAKGVLELPSTRLEETGTRIGDEVLFLEDRS